MTSQGRPFGTLRLSLPAVACAGWLAMLTPGIGQGLRAPASPDSSFARCRTIRDDAARLRCYQDAVSNSGMGSALPDIGASAWRLVRTPNPEGGRDAISIMRTADTSQSDLDLAGLMLRCGDSATEVLFVVIQPFSPRVHPKVTLQTGSTTNEFMATIVAPGSLVLLPAEAATLPERPWQSATELHVLIEGDERSVRGVVPLTGLATALQLLHSNCQR